MCWCIRGQGGSGDEGANAGAAVGIVECIGAIFARGRRERKSSCRNCRVCWCIRVQGGSGDEGANAGAVVGIVECVGVFVALADQATKARTQEQL